MQKTRIIFISIIIVSSHVVLAQDKKSPREIVLEEMGYIVNQQLETGFAQSTDEALSRVYESKLRLFNRLNDIGTRFPKPKKIKNSADVYTEKFHKQLFKYFYDNGFIIYSGIIPFISADGKVIFIVYQNLYPIETTRTKKLGDVKIFSDMNTKSYKKFCVKNWRNKNITIVKVGDGLVNLELFFLSLSNYAIKGVYGDGYIILTNNITNFPSTLAHELGHAFLEMALGLGRIDIDKTFNYNGKKNTLIEFHELFAHFIELKFGDNFGGVINKTVKDYEGQSEVYQYTFTIDVFTRVIKEKNFTFDHYDTLTEEEQKKVQEDIISALENEIFTKILPVIKTVQ